MQFITRQHYAVFLYRAFSYVEQSKTGSTGTSNLVTSEGSVAMQKKLAEIRTEHTDVFLEDKPIYTTWFDKHPISLKIYENGLDELDVLDMYLYTDGTSEYVSSILVTFDGYNNPTERLGKAAVTFVGNGDKYGNFNFDFREEKAEMLTLEWLDIVFPQLADRLSPLVKEKEQDARENLKDPLADNMERIYMDGYEIQIGVNTFKEMFVLDIREPM